MSKKKTPFCKICYDFNRSEEEYTSHWVKDKPGPDGNVICPLLLNMECRYCHEKGHLISNCPILKQKKQNQKTSQIKSVVTKSSEEAKIPSLEFLKNKLNVEGLPKIPSTLPPLTWLKQETTKTPDDKTSISVPTYADKCKIKNNNNKTIIKKALKKEEKMTSNININSEKITEKKARPKLSWADMMEYESDDEENESNDFWLIE